MSLKKATSRICSLLLLIFYDFRITGEFTLSIGLYGHIPVVRLDHTNRSGVLFWPKLHSKVFSSKRIGEVSHKAASFNELSILLYPRYNV